MQAVRLVLIAMVVIAALTILGKAIPAGNKPLDRPVGEPFPEKPAETKASGSVIKRSIDLTELKLDAKPAEVIADVGDTVELKVKTKNFSTLVVPNFGVERDLSPDVETDVTFSVGASGRVPVKISQTGQVVLVISARSVGDKSDSSPDDQGQETTPAGSPALTPA